jgi:hypothetical protein
MNTGLTCGGPHAGSIDHGLRVLTHESRCFKPASGEPVKALNVYGVSI